MLLTKWRACAVAIGLTLWASTLEAVDGHNTWSLICALGRQGCYASAILLTVGLCSVLLFLAPPRFAQFGRLVFVVPIYESLYHGSGILFACFAIVAAVLARDVAPVNHDWSLEARTRPHRGYTLLPLLMAILVLCLGLFQPVATRCGHPITAARFGSPLACIVTMLIVVCPLLRALLAGVVWCITVRVAPFVTVLSALVCHDVFALVVIVADNIKLRGWLAALVVGAVAESLVSLWILWRLPLELEETSLQVKTPLLTSLT